MLRQSQVIKTLVTKYPLYNFSAKSDNKRLGNLDNISTEIVSNLIKDTFNPTFLEILPPGHPRNTSKTYDLILFTVNDTFFTVINAVKENKGKIFEDDLYTLLVNKDESTRPLLEYLGIELESDYRVINTSKENTSRNIYDSIKHSGEIISDLTVVHDGIDYYLSLKAANGKTIYSGKSINFIYDEHDSIKFDVTKYLTCSHGILFDELNIDVYRLINGLNKYNEKEQVYNTKLQHVEEKCFPFLRNLLVNSWSYGYHLIYEHASGIDALDLTQLSTVKKMVNDVIYSTIEYPNKDSKQLTITVNVENKITYETDVYKIEFRNAKGKILPLEIKVKRL